MIEYRATCQDHAAAVDAVKFFALVAARMPQEEFAIVIQYGEPTDVTVVSNDQEHLRLAYEAIDAVIDEVAPCKK